jgi:aldehyde dehydrogenase (NAD+)
MPLFPTKKIPAAPRGGAARSELIFGDLWEFDPAPETADPKLKARYELFIGGEFVRPRSGRYFDSINPANERKLAEIALGGPADVDAAYEAAAAGLPTWGKLPGRERGKYLYRIARLLQDRAREFAVAETMDNGKPIRESRDFDVPMARRTSSTTPAGPTSSSTWRRAGGRAARRRGPGDPLELPAAHAGVEARAGAGHGQLRRAQARRDTCITALKLAEILQDAGCRPGSSTFVTGAGETGAAVMAHPGPPRSPSPARPRSARRSCASSPAATRKMTMELGGKAANIVFDDAPIDQAVEGIVNGIFFNQGHVCCAGSRLLVHEPVADEVVAKLKNRLRVLRVGDPLDKNTDVGAINSRAQLDTIRGSWRAGSGRAPSHVPAAVPPAGEGLLLPADALHRGHAEPPDRARGDLRAGALHPHLPHGRRGDREGQQHPYGLSAGVWTDKGSRILRMSTELKAGVVWANTFNKFDPSSPFGGYKESGFGREGGRQGLLDYAQLSCLKVPHGRIPVTKTPKVYIGGAFVRSESARTFKIDDADRRVLRQHPPVHAQGPAQRRRGGRQGRAGLGQAHALQPRADPLPLAEMLEARSAELAARSRFGAPSADAAGDVAVAVDRLIHYAGWADKYEQLLGSVNPVASRISTSR